MPELAAFQDAFVDALRHGGVPAGCGDPGRLEAGMSVYRNTTYKGLVDALAANYPTVERLVGEAWFKASAYAYLDMAWPSEPSLVVFGEHYPDFLTFFEPAQALPYLAGVARLDRDWTEAHVAPDAPVLAPDALAHIAQDALPRLRLRLHPSVRLEWFELPSPTIWRLNRPPAPTPAATDLEWSPQGALIGRPYGSVDALILDAAGYAFLSACWRGKNLGEAAAAALAADPGADLAERIAAFVGFGAFQPLQ